jgi:hypothetical protein
VEELATMLFSKKVIEVSENAILSCGKILNLVEAD